MFADQQQEPPLVDDTLAVQIQRRAGGAANRGEANYYCVIIAPSKMFVPVVLAWVKQRDYFLTERIESGGFVIFEIVTALAGTGEIFSVAFAADGERDDMLVRERIGAIIFLTKTVFTTALRALLKQQAQFLGQSLSSHAKPV